MTVACDRVRSARPLDLGWIRARVLNEREDNSNEVVDRVRARAMLPESRACDERAGGGWNEAGDRSEASVELAGGGCNEAGDPVRVVGLEQRLERTGGWWQQRGD